MITLASASPARSQLLTQWGIQHQVMPTNIDEDVYKHSISDPKVLVETLARAKASSLTTDLPAGEAGHCSLTTTILSADTVVFLNRQIIGKPKDRQDAKRIISLLQAQTHQVWTGVCFANHLFSDMASVTFAPMTSTQIDAYLDANDWIGAAGAYRIQQAIKPFIRKIDGDINTIIGLPSLIKHELITVKN